MKEPLQEMARRPLSGRGSSKMSLLKRFAVDLMRTIGQPFVVAEAPSRKRGSSAADIVVQWACPGANRWNVRCVAGGDIDETQAATATGLMIHFRTDVAMVIASGVVTEQAAHFAESVRASSQRHLVLVDGELIKAVIDGRLALRDLIMDQAPSLLFASA
jgi:hypothetical protein